MPDQPEILVVDDDRHVRRSLQLLLRGHGYRVKAYPDPRAIAHDAAASGATLLLADYRMPGGTGFEVLGTLRAAGFAGAAILVTGHASDDLARQAQACGFDAVLDKPVRPTELLALAKAKTQNG